MRHVLLFVYNADNSLSICICLYWPRPWSAFVPECHLILPDTQRNPAPGYRATSGGHFRLPWPRFRFRWGPRRLAHVTSENKADDIVYMRWNGMGSGKVCYTVAYMNMKLWYTKHFIWLNLQLFYDRYLLTDEKYWADRTDLLETFHIYI